MGSTPLQEEDADGAADRRGLAFGRAGGLRPGLDVGAGLARQLPDRDARDTCSAASNNQISLFLSVYTYRYGLSPGMAIAA